METPTVLTPHDALICPNCGHHVASIAIARRKRVPKPVAPPGERPPDPRISVIADMLRANPGLSANQIFQQIGGKKTDVLRIVREIKSESERPSTIAFAAIAWPPDYDPDADLDLEANVADMLRREPGLSATRIFAAVGGRRQDVFAVVKKIKESL